VSADGPVPGLYEDSMVTRVGPGRARGEVSRRWWIERGPYGGYVAAFFVHALYGELDEHARPPRSLTIHFLDAPAEGPVEVETRVEREGRSASFLSQRMEQDGRPVALAVASAGAWRNDQADWNDLRMPAVPPPQDCAVLERGPGMPPFVDNFEVRWAEEAEPGRARNVTWVRTRPAMAVDHPVAAALSDTMVPAAFARLGRPAIVPTLDLTIHFRAPLPVEDSWTLAVFESRSSAGGTWVEDGELWSAGGVLLTQSRQLAMMRG
jgi:acyl-CoA thioesterase